MSTDEVYGSIDRAARISGGAWWERYKQDREKLIDGVVNDPANQFDEDTPLAGGSPYAASKGAADLLILAYQNTFKWDTANGTEDPDRMPVCIPRGVNNYGPFQHPEKLIPMAICTLLHPVVDKYCRRIPVYDRGSAIREWLKTDDYADAIIFLMKKANVGQVYNVGSGVRRSNADVIKEIWEHCRGRRGSTFKMLKDATFDASSSYGIARPGHDLAYAVNCNKLKGIGWKQPTQNFSDVIKEIVDWYDANRDWWEPTWTSKEFTSYWNGKYSAMNQSAPGLAL